MTSFTNRRHRLVTREQLDASRTAWDTGSFSWEWSKWRHLAAMQAGIIVPPEGTRWDQWDDERPSERAQIIRAIRESPQALDAALRAPRVHSWAAVIAQLVRRRESIVVETPSRDEPTTRQAGDILRRINTVLDPIDRARVVKEAGIL